MKCSQCGCEEFTLSRLPFCVGGDAFFDLSETFKIYVCNKCGHLEMFDTGLNEIRLDIANRIDELEKHYKELASASYYQNVQRIEEYKTKIRDLKGQLSNKDITIREHEQLSKEIPIQIRELEKKIALVLRETYPIEMELNKVKVELNSLKSKDLTDLYYKRYIKKNKRWLY